MKQIALIFMLVISMIPAYAKEVPSESVLMTDINTGTSVTGSGGIVEPSCACIPGHCISKDQDGNCIQYENATCTCHPKPACTCPEPTCIAKDQDGNCLEWKTLECICPPPTCKCPAHNCIARDQDGNCIEWENSTCNCPAQTKIDVVFVIDSTGSMGDEIRTVKDYIAQMVKFAPTQNYKLRVGVVTYRDYELEEKEYLIRSKDLTDDIDSALKFIETIDAAGGGDQPEAVADALHNAIQKDMSWSDDARKVIILIGDAPPHGEGGADRNYRNGSPNGYNYKDEITEASKRGITIYTLICSGMDEVGTRIWKTIADKTGGTSEHLSYQREDVDKYYVQQGLPATYATEAKKSADYDASTNTIMTNNIGVASKAIVAREANRPVQTPVKTHADETPKTSLLSEFWQKLIFWS